MRWSYSTYLRYAEHKYIVDSSVSADSHTSMSIRAPSSAWLPGPCRRAKLLSNNIWKYRSITILLVRAGSKETSTVRDVASGLLCSYVYLSPEFHLASTWPSSNGKKYFKKTFKILSKQFDTGSTFWLQSRCLRYDALSATIYMRRLLCFSIH